MRSTWRRRQRAAAAAPLLLLLAVALGAASGQNLPPTCPAAAPASCSTAAGHRRALLAATPSKVGSEPQAVRDAITNRLNALYEADEAAYASAGDEALWGGFGQVDGGANMEVFLASSSSAGSSPNAYGGSRSQVQRNLEFLQNGNLKVGADPERGGVISWLSSSRIPPPWRDQNLLNIWDQGRLLQQSFYGCVDGSCWAGRPWLYNPVQGGSWQNAPALTRTFQRLSDNHIYAEGLPRNWGQENIIDEVLFSSDIRLATNYVAVNFTMSYSGSTTHPYMTQEVPAVFVDRRFSVLAYYAGSKPWTNDRNITFAFPGQGNSYATTTEHWAAYIDPVTGWGIGVYNPQAWHGITAYRVGEDRSDLPWHTSYFAHTIRMQLHPGMKPYTYTSVIAVGRLNAIRNTFARFAASQGAWNEAGRRGGKQAGAGSAERGAGRGGPADGQPDLGHREDGTGAAAAAAAAAAEQETIV